MARFTVFRGLSHTPFSASTFRGFQRTKTSNENVDFVTLTKMTSLDSDQCLLGAAIDCKRDVIRYIDRPAYFEYFQEYVLVMTHLVARGVIEMWMFDITR
jgi:hypothetical protein